MLLSETAQSAARDKENRLVNSLETPTQSRHPQLRQAEASIDEADAQPLSAPIVRRPHGRNIRPRLLLIGGLIALLLLGGAVAFVRFTAPPSDLDYSTER